MATTKSKSRALKGIRFLTPEEARALFDEQARRWLNMSGEEFVKAWDSGAFDDNPDRPEVIHLVVLLPLVR